MTSPSTPAGEVKFDGDLGTITFVRTVPHSPARVWAAITTPAELRQWFMSDVTIDARLGGSIQLVSGPARFKSAGAILAWDPPRTFEYEWNVEPRPELPAGERAFVRWELEAVEGGTRLTMVQRRLTRATTLGFAPGTHVFLDRLAALLDGTQLPEWMGRYGQVAGAYPAFERP